MVGKAQGFILYMFTSGYSARRWEYSSEQNSEVSGLTEPLV